MVGTARSFGQTAGVAIAGTILAWRQGVYAAGDGSGGYPSREAAYLLSQRDAFVFIVGISLAGAALVLCLPSRRRNGYTGSEVE